MLVLFLAGGLLLWLGGFGYMKHYGSPASRPIGWRESLFAFNGIVSVLLALPYLVIGGFWFGWWIPLAFIFGAGVTVAVVHKVSRGLVPLFFSVYGVPPGVACILWALLGQ